ncbi:hypothetical protein ACLIBG_06050 [Virgibacillus sp. W0181]|uniref:hypothetical protein n=1 Tax=Virgibacillus sp. W0181 TaxID=3391581 RepID=UPI003F450153
MNYLKLLNFEVNRIANIFAGLLLLTVVFQFVGQIWITNSYLSEAKDLIQYSGMSQATFIEQYGRIDMFQIVQSLWFVAPIAIAAGALMFYIFLIWYRDWFGKNTFVYRLLMLPTSRVNVLLAKLSTIMIAVLGLVSFQYILLIIQSTVLKWMVPRDFRVDLTVPEIVGNLEYLSIIMPESFTQFLLHYGAGLTFLMICFTIVLLERSFRVKGAIMGVGYGIVSLGLFLLPYLILLFVVEKDILYPAEHLFIQIGIGAIVLAVSTWLSSYLIKNKVTV